MGWDGSSRWITALTFILAAHWLHKLYQTLSNLFLQIFSPVASLSCSHPIEKKPASAILCPLATKFFPRCPSWQPTSQHEWEKITARNDRWVTLSQRQRLSVFHVQGTVQDMGEDTASRQLVGSSWQLIPPFAEQQLETAGKQPHPP